MSTWYKCTNGENVKPEAVDITSSRKWAYVRKDFQQVAATEDIPEHWEWMELKIPLETLELYTKTVENATNVDTLTECILEMSEIIYA